MIDYKNVLITGGAGTLGKAIIARAEKEQWDCHIDVLSRDPMKHVALKQLFPNVNCVVGDVTDIYRMGRYDVIIHAAAQKHIPQGEVDTSETIRINVIGSLEVARFAIQSGAKHVVGISTDKAVHCVNAYGATKYLMEKTFQELAREQSATQFHLVRYGNVLGSTGSVIQVWRQMLEERGVVRATSPNFTRFWLTDDEAVSLILHSLTEPPGAISVPRCGALSMGKLADYTLPEGTKINYVGARPGEKLHEEMLSEEEAHYVEPQTSLVSGMEVMRLWSTVHHRSWQSIGGYSSDSPDHEFTKEEILAMIGE